MKDWYLVPVRLVGENALAAVNAKDQPVYISGMWFHVGRVEASPTEGIYGVPPGTAVPDNWQALTKEDAVREFQRLFARTPAPEELP